MSTPTTLQRVAFGVIKNHADTPLSTLSPKKKLICTSAEASTSFTSEQLFWFQADLGLSNGQTRLPAQDLRVATGSRKAAEHGFKESLTKNIYTVNKYFKELRINYLKVDKDTKVSEHFEQSTIVCRDLCKFVDLVLQKRSLENNKSQLVKVGIDSGHGFLKICLSVFDMDNLVSGSKVGLSMKFKDSGVKKVFLVAAVPDVPENYQSVKLWLNLELQNLDRRFTIATDLKSCNILLEMMLHSSCHPCCWCDMEKVTCRKKGTRRTIASKNHSFFEQSLLGLFWGKYQ